MTDLDNIKMTKVSVHITYFMAATKVFVLWLESGVQQTTTNSAADKNKRWTCDLEQLIVIFF
jgi:hypothetical protein